MPSEEHIIDTWQQWSKHILSELRRLNEHYVEMSNRLNEVAVEIAALKVKAGTWGLVGGMIPVIITLLILILQKELK